MIERNRRDHVRIAEENGFQPRVVGVLASQALACGKPLASFLMPDVLKSLVGVVDLAKVPYAAGSLARSTTQELRDEDELGALGHYLLVSWY